jgi:hypothetical protein
LEISLFIFPWTHDGEARFGAVLPLRGGGFVDGLKPVSM